MRNEHENELIDLGDAVAETKGTAILGQVDPLSGYRSGAGFSNED
ncbi:benenodin family lasso peptide [Sphingomonas japonica]|uniref:Benenodin family lasso peptide n=1 Tax=Sphingomonas japonica TaxID=511662 RepID=A0ABX0U3X1_9SPHN|nr:benenodin family lasso peptide [Sphingomonas japonica]NIJ25198.1 hypothetical protein [Sphingomonas japonica]